MTMFVQETVGTALNDFAPIVALLMTGRKESLLEKTNSKILKRIGQLSDLVTHRPEHRDYIDSLGFFQKRGLLRRTFRSRYKYIGNYLAPFLSTQERRRAIQFHYDYLVRNLGAVGQAQWGQRATLWRREVGGSTIEIALDEPGHAYLEGERQLRFLMDGTSLFTLTFVVMPADLLGLQGQSALFVGSVMGGFQRREEIRTAAKLNDEIAPSTMLFLTVRALANALGVDHLAGIASAAQPATEYAGERVRFDYDGFWATFGGSPVNAGVHSIPLAETHDDRIDSKHRSRTRRRRQLRAAISSGIEAKACRIFRVYRRREQIAPVFMWDQFRSVAASAPAVEMVDPSDARLCLV